MKPFPLAVLLSSTAFMVGLMIVAVGLQYRHLGSTLDTPRISASDDMGTSGIGYADR